LPHRRHPASSIAFCRWPSRSRVPASLRVSLVGELDRASNPVEERQCYSQQQLCRCRLEDMVAWRGADALLRI
ncbi:hypothetical protein EJB05_45810, partial [Eragrostis curvula]